MIERLHDTGWNNFKTMDQGRPVGATVHRTKPSEKGYADSAEGVRDFFRLDPECSLIAKASIPFHIVIEPSGKVVQTAPLNQHLWHACALNKTHIGICCVGDFRANPMPAAQRAALVGVCVGLVTQDGSHIGVDEILGHTERPEGHGPAIDDSPGKMLGMQQLRDDVRRTVQKHRPVGKADFAFTAEAFEA